jgi:glycosyltransferase involved in cell wall biosynthesis
MTRTSGVIATLDQKDYVTDAVRSLAAQVDELIVVDDASIDGTPDIAERLASNVTVLRNPERLGISRSFARAVDAATGELIFISGGDDFSLPGRVATQSAALEDPGVTLVSSVPVLIDALGRILPGDVAPEFSAKPPDVGALEFLYFGANFICAPAVALRRADFVRFGGFPPHIDHLQDHALWLTLAAAGEVVIAETPVLAYRKHATNVSRQKAGLDARLDRRRIAEREWLLENFLVRASPETRMRLATSRGIPGDRFAALTDLEQLALIQVNHVDPLVVRRGLARLFEVAAGVDGDARLAAMGLEPAELDSFALAADHANVSAVMRALGLAGGEPK